MRNFLTDSAPTLVAKAVSRWRFWLARAFGEKFSGHDIGITIVGYRYKGMVYFTKEKRSP